MSLDRPPLCTVFVPYSRDDSQQWIRNFNPFACLFRVEFVEGFKGFAIDVLVPPPGPDEHKYPWWY